MSNIKVFEDKKIRTEWNEQEEDWYFSVVDIVGILTDKDYDDARKYWKVLKGRLKSEGSELVSFCYQLKLPAQDGKLRETDVLNTKWPCQAKRVTAVCQKMALMRITFWQGLPCTLKNCASNTIPQRWLPI